jgi:hypothetical protein
LYKINKTPYIKGTIRNGIKKFLYDETIMILSKSFYITIGVVILSIGTFLYYKTINSFRLLDMFSCLLIYIGFLLIIAAFNDKSLIYASKAQLKSNKPRYIMEIVIKSVGFIILWFYMF